MTQSVWDWEAIKAEVYRRGGNFTQIAIENGFASSVCLLVKHRRHRRAQEAIAAFIDQQPEDLWPDRYVSRKKPRRVSSTYQALLARRRAELSAAMVNDNKTDKENAA